MALKHPSAEHHGTVGHVSREATVAVDERVAAILLRRQVALREARLAAQQLRRP